MRVVAPIKGPFGNSHVKSGLKASQTLAEIIELMQRAFYPLPHFVGKPY